MPRAGQYRTLATFEEDIGADNAVSGQHEEAWQPLASDVWCDLMPLSGREFVAAQQLVTNITHRLRVRYNPTLTFHPRLRLKVGERVLHISHVLDVEERHVELEMLCTEAQ